MAERFTRDIHKDYEKSDLEHVYRTAQPKSWQDIDSWLQKNGLRDNELTPGETAHMLADLKEVEKAKVPFTANPDEAVSVLKKHRSQQAVEQWTQREIKEMERMRH